MSRSSGDGPGPLAEGEALASDHVFESGAHELTLEVERGARIVVERGARFARSVASPTGLALGAGALRATLIPDGNSGRSPLRIATPCAIVELGASGDVFVATLADGSSFIAVLQGAADVFRGAVDARGRIASVRLVAGRSLILGKAAAAESLEGPSTLEEARAIAARLPAQGGRLGGERAALSETLSSAVRAFEMESSRGSELRRSHRAAVAAGGPEALELQSRIVSHAQALLRARRAVKASFERAEALRAATEGSDEWLHALRSEAAAALRLPTR
ncbi:MAG: hypothetical protein H5U40_01845 [Polyangiaceae bacterium]|nr:hypothetical protein [Polyangiaceae bacterium]